MSDKEKIEEMAEVIKTELAIEFGGGDTVEPEDFPCQAEHIAEALIAADYCKRSEAVKEVLEKLGAILNKRKADYQIDSTSPCDVQPHNIFTILAADVYTIAANLGAEVGK